MLQLWEEGEIVRYRKEANVFHCQSVHCLVGEADMKANDDEIWLRDRH